MSENTAKVILSVAIIISATVLAIVFKNGKWMWLLLMLLLIWSD